MKSFDADSKVRKAIAGNMYISTAFPSIYSWLSDKISIGLVPVAWLGFPACDWPHRIHPLHQGQKRERETQTVL